MTEVSGNHSAAAVIFELVSMNVKEDRTMNENMVWNLLKAATPETAKFHEKTLPYLCEDWWGAYVVPAVPLWRREKARNSPSSFIFNLDLAPLLVVLARNWRALSGSEDTDYARLNCINQMRTIRNKSAHPDGKAASLPDLIDDLRTILRFLDLIAADESLIRRAKMAYEDAVIQLAATFLKRNAA